MTRINLISVQELTDQHLLAEHRELKRIPSMIQKWKVILAWIPKEFCLWKWHVKFFYNKLWFLQKRYLEIFAECKKRWFEVENYSGNFIWINKELFWDFEPTKDDIELSRQRIIQKLEAKPWFYKYYWKNIIDITFIMIILILLL